MTTQKSWTPKEYSYIFGLAKFGYSPEWIGDILVADVLKHRTKSAILQCEVLVQKIWNKVEGTHPYNQRTMPGSRTEKVIKEAMRMQVPPEIEEYRPKDNKFASPRRPYMFANAVGRGEAARKAKGNPIVVPVVNKIAESPSYNVIETAKIFGLVMSGYASVSVATSMVNTLGSSRPIHEILQQEAHVRAFILKRYNREREANMTSYPVGINLQVIVNASKENYQKLIGSLWVDNATVCAQKSLKLTPKLVEEEEAVQQEIPFKASKPTFTSITKTDEGRLTDEIIASAAARGVQKMTWTNGTITINLEF